TLAEELKALQQRIPQDPVVFMRDWLGFQPTEYQLDLIKKFRENQFLAARWCRQSGKSHTIAALLLHYALTHPNINIGVVGPSWRQTKLIIRRINQFLRKIPKGYYCKPQHTMVRLKNGSIIEAFPNNPETIRGHTLHVVYADEFNFIPNDEAMYDAIIFTLGTTNGKFICTSTPWSTDSIFWRIFNDPAYSDFAKSHITYEQALEPNGPLKREILEKIRRQLEGDPWRWRREMLAEWAENESVWLPQALITSCIDHALEYYAFEESARGEFYAGLDLGKMQDYSVLTVIAKEDDVLKVVHVNRFPLKTPYAAVIGYVKTLCDRWSRVNKVLVDMSGVGDYVVEDMRNAGIREAEGVKFTVESKMEMAQWLKQCMVEKKLRIPYDPELIAELNIERFELTKDGKIKFSHPEGSHDDRFWSLALAVYAARAPPKPRLVVVPR
ncbi:MAG: terminase family protein, partial [Candidatus Bathyarchaeia archaeon]